MGGGRLFTVSVPCRVGTGGARKINLKVVFGSEVMGSGPILCLDLRREEHYLPFLVFGW